MTSNNKLLKELRESRKTYAQMVNFCADDMILNNNIALAHSEFEVYSGQELEYLDGDGNYISREEYEELQANDEECEERYAEVYQYYIISESGAKRFAAYTNELLIYNEELDLYMLCVCHWGTAWDCVPSNWKNEGVN